MQGRNNQGQLQCTTNDKSIHINKKEILCEAASMQAWVEGCWLYTSWVDDCVLEAAGSQVLLCFALPLQE
jgi:hypothetical protein